jgi:peptide/nickel transport system substrate-binding protein
MMIGSGRGASSLSRRRMLQETLAWGALAGAGARCSWAADNSILRVRARADIQTLDPAFRVTRADSDVIRCLFASLAMYQEGLEWGWTPFAAKSIVALDPTHVSFELNPGIMYSDGYGEVTAEDAKFSFERMINPALKSPFAQDWATLDHVEVKDRYSGVIVLKAPFAPLWLSTLPTPSAVIMPKKALAAVGGTFTTQPPVTSGPYRIKSWEPKTKLVLSRNPDWKLTTLYFDEIHILPIEDDKTAELGFESNAFDCTWTSVSSIPRYLRRVPKGARFTRRLSLGYIWFGLNQDHPKLKNPLVRRAIQYAIDRKGVVDAAYFGAAEPSTGIIPAGLPGHRERNLYDHDLDKAMQLLKQANVEGLSLTLAVLNKAERLAAAQTIQSNLAEAHIKVEIQSYDNGTFWTLGAEKDGGSWKDLQLMINGFTLQPDPSWATAWFTSDKIGTWNWERFRSAEFDRLAAQGLAELDPIKRNAIYVKMQDLMETSGDFVFLTHEANGVLYGDKIAPALMPDGIPVMADFRKAR